MALSEDDFEVEYRQSDTKKPDGRTVWTVYRKIGDSQTLMYGISPSKRAAVIDANVAIKERISKT